VGAAARRAQSVGCAVGGRSLPSRAVIAAPAVGMDDRPVGRGRPGKGGQRAGGPVGQDREAKPSRARPADLDRHPAKRLLPALTPAAPAFLEPSEDELVDLHVVFQRLALGSHHRAAKLLQDQPCGLIAESPSWRYSCLAEIPGWCVATRYAAQNHSRSAVRVPCMTVPAVTDVCRWQAHSHRCRRSSTHARRPPRPDRQSPPASATPPSTPSTPTRSRTAR
jgi:hypothetical protein